MSVVLGLLGSGPDGLGDGNSHNIDFGLRDPDNSTLVDRRSVGDGSEERGSGKDSKGLHFDNDGWIA